MVDKITHEKLMEIISKHPDVQDIDSACKIAYNLALDNAVQYVNMNVKDLDSGSVEGGYEEYEAEFGGRISRINVNKDSILKLKL